MIEPGGDASDKGAPIRPEDKGKAPHERRTSRYGEPKPKGRREAGTARGRAERREEAARARASSERAHEHDGPDMGWLDSPDITSTELHRRMMEVLKVIPPSEHLLDAAW